MKLTNTADFGSALEVLSAALHMVVVEHIEDSASLYGCSIAQHHVCLLVKAQVCADQTVSCVSNSVISLCVKDGGFLSVNAKGTESQLVSNLLDEIKALV